MDSVWPRCLERLEAELPAEDIHTWLKPLQADPRADGLTLYAPNAFVVDTVRDHYLARIRELMPALRRRRGRGVAGSRLAARARRPPCRVCRPPHRPRAGRSTFQGNLDTHYTFDNFVEGPQQPAGPRRGAAGRAEPRPRLQPAAAVRRHRPGQDPPDVRRRQFDAARQPGHAGAVPALGTVLQRDDEVRCRTSRWTSSSGSSSRWTPC